MWLIVGLVLLTAPVWFPVLALACLWSLLGWIAVGTYDLCRYGTTRGTADRYGLPPDGTVIRDPAIEPWQSQYPGMENNSVL